MSRSAIFSGKEIMRALEKAGYLVARQRGSHIRLRHPHKKSVTVPNHKIIGRGLLRKILRDAEFSLADFLKLIE